jgi:hypothetical protein
MVVIAGFLSGERGGDWNVGASAIAWGIVYLLADHSLK